MWTQAVLYSAVLAFGIFLPSAIQSVNGLTVTGDVGEGRSFKETTIKYIGVVRNVNRDRSRCCQECKKMFPDSQIFIYRWTYCTCYKTIPGVQPVTIWSRLLFSGICADCECGVKNGRITFGRKKRIAIKGGAKRFEADADPNEYPWQVLIEKTRPINTTHTRTSTCGGSIISSRTILTAAHCLHKNTSSIYVYVGLHNQNNKNMKNVKKIKVENFTLHDNWNKAYYDNDAALLFLKEDITWNYAVKPICLPQNNAALYEGVDVSVAGWGRDYSYNNVDLLREAEMKTMTNDQCGRQNTTLSNNFQPNITESKICAYSKTEWTCVGDSGGALITEVDNKNYYEQIGVVSNSARGNPTPGPGYCKDTFESPGVFTRVTAIMDWINQYKNGTTCARPS